MGVGWVCGAGQSQGVGLVVVQSWECRRMLPAAHATVGPASSVYAAKRLQSPDVCHSREQERCAEESARRVRSARVCQCALSALRNGKVPAARQMVWRRAPRACARRSAPVRASCYMIARRGSSTAVWCSSVPFVCSTCCPPHVLQVLRRCFLHMRERPDREKGYRLSAAQRANHAGLPRCSSAALILLCLRFIRVFSYAVNATRVRCLLRA